MMARNADLEAEIAKTPDDPAPYLVYADWLTEQGDPRGELITLGVQIAGGATSPELRAREARLHAEHDATWLGGLARQPGFAVTWRYGFVHVATIGGKGKQAARRGAPSIDPAASYAQLRSLAVAALLRELTFDAFDDDDGQPSWRIATDALIEHGVAPTLVKLAFDRGTYWDISWTHLGSLAPLYAHVPQLESLRIALGNFTLGAIDLPNLRVFETYTGGFTSANMREVLGARWPQLESLILRFGNSEDYGGDCTLEDALPLVAASNLPRVKHLAIANAGFVNGFVEPLAKSDLLRRLETLDLSMGTLGDEGARFIVHHADAFAHLARLDVSQSYVSSGMLAELRRVVRQVDGDDQQEPDENEAPENRFVQIGE